MKTAINKVTKQGYSNYAIAKKIGVSTKLIHRHRKNFSVALDRAIEKHFLLKGYTPKLPQDFCSPEKKFKESKWSKVKYYLRSFLYKIKRWLYGKSNND
ncbi:hypothetical protein MROS_2533 [Melioribacter roseus P3M-2]|jgi:hypothetical protein|uniref:Uncharacterized protein n=1 Tax=Melioribacter roseus (strain DSM 23840 / JCM 17771 / VKM B-2668 / P3M-2) TaxID=1191523 RepID=I7A3G5_MELRP|nr:hypothetical protein [Melioribacter roseus]AFN75763.1 hypothetical protein MROS_2533 [Melioribacter roseus P3M-2]